VTAHVLRLFPLCFPHLLRALSRTRTRARALALCLPLVRLLALVLPLALALTLALALCLSWSLSFWLALAPHTHIHTHTHTPHTQDLVHNMEYKRGLFLRRVSRNPAEHDLDILSSACIDEGSLLRRHHCERVLCDSCARPPARIEIIKVLLQQLAPVARARQIPKSRRQHVLRNHLFEHTPSQRKTPATPPSPSRKPLLLNFSTFCTICVDHTDLPV